MCRLGDGVLPHEVPMRADFASQHRPFEFTNDMHWNSHGHAVAAAAVREALTAWPPLAARRD